MDKSSFGSYVNVRKTLKNDIRSLISVHKGENEIETISIMSFPGVSEREVQDTIQHWYERFISRILLLGV